MKYPRRLTFTLLIFLGLLISLLLADTIWKPGLTEIVPTKQTPIISQASQGLQEEQRGRDRYRQGDFQEAIAIWESVAQTYGNEGYFIAQARVLSNLSLAYQHLGKWQLATEAIARSIALLENAGLSGLSVFAQAMNTQGQLYLATGNPEAAFSAWETAEELYHRDRQEMGVFKARINQATALQQLGLYRRASLLLADINNNLQQQETSPEKAIVLIRLGNLLSTLSRFNEAQSILQEGLTIATNLNLNSEQVTALIGLGNVAKNRKDYTTALDYYQQALNRSPSPQQQAVIELAKLSLFAENQQWQAFSQLLPRTKYNLNQLPSNQTTIYYRLNLGKHWSAFHQAQNPQSSWQDILELYTQATQEAIDLGDQRAQAFGLGYIASVYEQTQQWQIAPNITQNALILSQQIKAPDISYLWLWQLGRIQQAQGKPEKAIYSYLEAVNLIGSLSQDIASVGREFQFSFQNSIEPVYRELVSLLLETTPPGNSISQNNLSQAINVIESLKVAELDKFFRADCVDIVTRKIDEIDPSAAVIYPIILKDNLHVIVSKPNQPLVHHQINVSQTEVEATIKQLSEALVIRSRRDFYEPGQKLYNWVIRPIAEEINPEQIKTLVFVPDGSFRNIPMATLYDGEKYLIETYSIAITPGLQLLSDKSIKQLDLKVLAGGLTEERYGFSPLIYVADEIATIQSETASKVLLNQDFTNQLIRQKLELTNYPIVHFATHDQFSSQLDETFILAWDGS
ncbi:CHAT domain-containing protein [Limnospira fusiformis]|uniref:CHAT domain-containing protein n=1 Tax=Limnospira fusiformis TaxID=54297 RepID=UPI00296F8AE9